MFKTMLETCLLYLSNHICNFCPTKLQFNESIPFIRPSSQCGVSSMQLRVIGGVDAKIGSWPWQVCFIFKFQVS